MQLPDINITKKQLIDAMPWIAIFVILAGAFIPVDIALKAYIGLAFGTAGAVLFPYYRKWKESSETLKFGLIYMIPLIIAVFVAISGVAFEEAYLWILAETAGWPSFMGLIVYGGMILVGYGGKALFIGAKNNLPFLEGYRLGSVIEHIKIVIDEIKPEDTSSEIHPPEESPSDIHDADDEDVPPAML